MYVFYEFAKSEVSYTIGVGVSDKGVSGSGSMTIKPGEPMVKMARKDGHKHVCLVCLIRNYKKVAKSMFLTGKGKCAFVSSGYVLKDTAFGG